MTNLRTAHLPILYLLSVPPRHLFPTENVYLVLSCVCT